MSQSQSGQIVNATVIPAGPYGTHEDIYGKGGLVTLTDAYADGAITTTLQQDEEFINEQIKLLRRKVGMIAYLVQTKRYYSCQEVGTDETNGNWKREYFNGRYHYGPEAPTADDIQMGERWFDTRVGTEYTYLKLTNFDEDDPEASGEYAWIDIDHLGSHVKYFYSSAAPTMGEYGERLHLGDKWFNSQVGSELTYLPSGLSDGIVTKFAWIDLDSPGGFFLSPVGELPERAIQFFYGSTPPSPQGVTIREGDKWFDSSYDPPEEFTRLRNDSNNPSNLVWRKTVILPDIPDISQLTRYFYGATAPTSDNSSSATQLRIGDRWFNTSNGSEFTYIPIDSNGIQDPSRRAWVDIDHIGSGQGGAASIALTPQDLDFIVSALTSDPNILGFVPIEGNTIVSGALTASSLGAVGAIAGNSLSINNAIDAFRLNVISLTANSAQINGPLNTTNLSVSTVANIGSMTVFGDVGIGGTAFISNAVKSSVSSDGGVETPELNEFITRNYAEQSFRKFKPIASSLKTKKPGYEGITGTVFALQSFGPFIVAGGQFSSAGGTGSTGIALWDGGKWNSMKGGVNGVVKVIQPRELEVGLELRGSFNTDPSDFSVGDGIQVREGGSTSESADVIAFGTVAFVGNGRLKLEDGFFPEDLKDILGNGWNIINASTLDENQPVNWLNLSSGPDRASDALLGEVFVGGTFSSPASNVARYDFTNETWSGLSAGGVEGVNASVLSMKLFRNSIDLKEILFIGGEFSGGVSAFNIEPEEETINYSWRSLGNGVSGSVMTMDFGAISYGITFTGQFYKSDDENTPDYIDSNKWTRFSSVYITNDGTTNGDSFAIGTFQIAREIDPTAGITSFYTMHITPQVDSLWSGLTSGWKVILSPENIEPENEDDLYWFQLTENPIQPSTSRLTKAHLFVGGNIEEAGGSAANGIGRYDIVDSTWSVPITEIHGASSVTVNALVSFYALDEKVTKLLLATNLDGKLRLVKNDDVNGEFGDYTEDVDFPFSVTGNVNAIYGLSDLGEGDIAGEPIEDRTDFLIVGDFDFVNQVSAPSLKTGKMFLIDVDILEASKTYVKYMYNDSIIGEIHSVCSLSEDYALHDAIDFTDIPLCVGGNFSSTDITISATSSTSGPSNLAIWNAEYFHDISTVSSPRYLTSLPFRLFNHNDGNPSEDGQVSKLSHGFCGRILKREIPVLLDKPIGFSYDWESLKFGNNPSIGRYSNVPPVNIFFAADGGFHEFVKIKNFKRTTPVNTSLSQAALNSCTLVNENEIWIDDKWLHTSAGATQGKGYSLDIHLFEVT